MGCAGSAPRPGLATPISDDIQVDNNGFESAMLEAVETTAVVEHNMDQILKHENSKNLSKDFSSDTLHQFHSDCDIIEDKLDFSIDSYTSETEENIFDMDREVVTSGKVAFSDVINKIDDRIEVNNEIKELETIIENVVMNDEVTVATKKEEALAEPAIELDEKEKEPEDVSKEDSNNNDKVSMHEYMDSPKIEDDNEGSESIASPPATLGARRPTKWEALADVVAELPPRLSVDALTGQIFSAAKRE